MTQSLSSLERLRQAAAGSTSEDDRLLEALLAACSDAIRRWCGRGFSLTELDEVLDGTPGDELLLAQYPVQAISSVRGSPSAVLELINDEAEQARATVTRAGLELVRVVSGVKTLDTSVTWASCPDLASVATAVNALGSGWQARAAPGYTAWPAQDLYVSPPDGADRSAGALACAGGWASFRLHVAELADYTWAPRGALRRPGGWEGGPGAWRVQYTAGYSTVPESVQLAACLWAAEMFAACRRDPSLASQALAGQVAQTFLAPASGPPPRVLSLLSPHRARRV
jgi:hypothetical protein